MWAHARLCFSPARGSCTLQTLSITRDLRTQCINFHPRGHTRHDAQETRRRTRICDDVQPHTHGPNRSTYRDRRSIDSMDPVVLKYMNMINDLRSKASGIEKVNETHFGSIRFDRENIPHFHGQFDNEYEGLSTKREEDAAGFHLKLDTSASGSTVVKISEQENLESSSHNGNHFQELQARCNASQELKALGEVERMRNNIMDAGECGSKHQTVMQDSGGSKESYTDERLREDSHSSPRNYICTDSEGGRLKDRLVTQVGAAHDNYIDECMFGDTHSFSVGNSMRPEPLQAAPDTEHVDREIGNRRLKGLNYIDEVFFKDSLENLEINSEPAIDYSEIKKDLEDKLLNREECYSDGGSKAGDGKILSHTTKNTVEQKGIKDYNLSDNKVKEHFNTTKKSETPKSAFEYVVKKRQGEHKKQHGLAQEPGDGSNKSYKKILSLVSEKTKTSCTRHEMLKSLKSSILYNEHDIVGLYKPYGLAMHGGEASQHHILTEYLPELANFLKAEALFPVHRLDATTTGVILLARTTSMADILKSMFKERQLKKTYWAITKGVPGHLEGIIDIPVGEGMVDGQRRMVLKPDVKGITSANHSSKDSKVAITRFKVISERENAALVELSPLTGVKHQLRVHMGFGLSCPILGDHKYSHLKKMAPQRLPGDVLDRLRIKQSKVRHLPLFLHCKSILVPEIIDGRNIFIYAKVPAYFNKALSLLKLNRHASKVKLGELVASLPCPEVAQSYQHTDVL